MSSTSLVGSGSSIVTLTTTILKQSVQTCTSTQLSTISSSVTIMTSVVTKVTTLVTQYQTVEISKCMQILKLCF